MTGGDRLSARLGATGLPLGPRGTFRALPAGAGLGAQRRGLRAGRFRDPETRRGFGRWRSPGWGRYEGSTVTTRSASRTPGERRERGVGDRRPSAGASHGQWWREPDLGDPGEDGRGWVRASDWSWPASALPRAEVGMAGMVAALEGFGSGPPRDQGGGCPPRSKHHCVPARPQRFRLNSPDCTIGVWGSTEAGGRWRSKPEGGSPHPSFPRTGVSGWFLGEG